MLKVWSRLSLLVLALLCSLSVTSGDASSGDASSGDAPSSADLRGGDSPCIQPSDGLPPGDEPATAARADASSGFELDGSQDDLADQELALPSELRVPRPLALQRRSAGQRAAARRAPPDDPFKPPRA